MGGCSFAPHSLLQRPPHKKKALALPSKCLTQKQRWNHLTGSTPHLTGFTPFLQIKWWIKSQWNPSWLPLQQKKISPINFKVASCHPPSSSHHPRSCLSKTMSSNSGKNIKFFECAQMSYLAYHTGPRYTTSMHWSLTQFTPASMSILTDVVERCEIPCCFCQLHWKYFRNPFGP